MLSRHGIGLAVLFGSRARTDAHERSDVDLGVLRVDGRSPSLRALGLLRHDLTAHVAVRLGLVDLATADALVRFEIARDGVVVYADHEERRKSFVARTLVDHDDVAHSSKR